MNPKLRVLVPSARGRARLSVINESTLFWIPAVLRLGQLAGAGVVGFFFGPIIGLVTAVLGVGAMMIAHLYLLRLSTWLDDSGQSRLPDGWGAWTDVYARLYRMRRDDEKTRPNWPNGWRASARP
jgi:hypothetical protein